MGRKYRESLWDSNDSDKDNMFESMADNFDVLYDTARPVILSQQDVDSLCDLIHILKTEIIEGQLTGHRYNVHAMENITLNCSGMSRSDWCTGLRSLFLKK